MILQRMAILQGLFGVFKGGPAARYAAAQMARRWQPVGARYPELRRDLLTLGGVFQQPPIVMENGQPSPGHKTEYQCGREDGRRELATQLLALMGLTPDDLNQLLEDDDADL